MENETEEQTNNRPWLYKKGQSGNPGGRPAGSISMKVWLRNRFSTMNDEQREEYLEGMTKIDILKMAEGAPDTKTDVTTKGEALKSDVDLDALAEKMSAKLKEEKI